MADTLSNSANASVSSSIPMATLPDETLNKFYQSILTTLPRDQIEYNPVKVQDETVDSIAKQIDSYLRSRYDTAIKSRKAQTEANKAAIDADAISRGMGASTYVTDMKNRQANAEASDISNLNSDYASNLAEQVQTQYRNYQANKLSADSLNSQNQIEVDKWNSETRMALEQLAYERALQARSMAGTGSGGRSRSSGRSGSPGLVPNPSEEPVSSPTDKYSYARSYDTDAKKSSTSYAKSIIAAYNAKKKK